MSSKLVKLGSPGLVDTSDHEVLKLVIMKSGATSLYAPHIPPKDIAKLLMNLSLDIMFNSIDMVAEQNNKNNSDNKLIEKPTREPETV